jgi:hypothetical protein
LSAVLRIEMILLAIGFLAFVFIIVNKRQLQMKYSLVWIGISFGMIIFAFFPQLVKKLAELTGIETTSNLIYLLGIITLLIITFSLSIIVSRQSDRIKSLIQIISIEKYLNEVEPVIDKDPTADESVNEKTSKVKEPEDESSI